MKLLMLIPYGCSLEGAWQSMIGDWAANHGLSLEVYQDKSQTWERIAALPPGSIFVGLLWDFSLDGFWSDDRLHETIKSLIHTLPQKAGALLFDTFTVAAEEDVEELIQSTGRDHQIKLLNGEGIDGVEENLGSILARLLQ